jgi:multidrug efflux system outer membrane protein
VLTAKRNLFDAELALTATRRLHLVSIVQLYKALGGGWSPKAIRSKDRRSRLGKSGALALNMSV